MLSEEELVGTLEEDCPELVPPLSLDETALEDVLSKEELVGTLEEDCSELVTSLSLDETVFDEVSAFEDTALSAVLPSGISRLSEQPVKQSENIVADKKIDRSLLFFIRNHSNHKKIKNRISVCR